MDEPPAMRPAEGSAHPQIRAWAEKIASCDGFVCVFVTPEYNHSVPGVLKTAIDYLYAEWNNKAAGFVSYGVAGGARAAEHLRSVCGALQMADVGQQVTLSLHANFDTFGTFVLEAHSVSAVHALLDQVVGWTSALAPLRAAGASV